MMNLVMFGYFVSTQFFNDMTDINLKEMLFNQQMKQIDDDLIPFGYIDDGSAHIEILEDNEKDHWQIKEFDPNRGDADTMFDRDL